jgi:SAM-dependent methyltransferase
MTSAAESPDGEVEMTPFTAHNMVLADGTRSIPGEALLLEQHPLPQAVLRTLDAFFPTRQPGEFSIVDLGCLEGGYTAMFARAGFSALGIDGRPGNVARCEFGAGQLGLPGLRFACDDVHNLGRYGSFDAIYCCGLLYHLEDPVSFLHMVSQFTRRVLILHTHFATYSASAQFPDLSPLTTHEGVLGRWFPEHPEGSTHEEMLRHPWSSIGNTRSFWVEKRHLLQTLIDAGFAPVYEQYDFLHDVVRDDYISEADASLFVAVRQ